MKALSINNKMLTQGSRILVLPTQDNIISFNVRGTCFPDTKSPVSIVQIQSSLQTDKMYINFSDGTGEHEFEAKRHANEIMYYFQDLKDPSKIGTIDRNYNQERTVNIRFEKPSRLSIFHIRGSWVFGDFPSGLGFFGLDSIKLDNVNNITHFPTSFKGGRYRAINFSKVLARKEKKLPEWFSMSEIKELTLLDSVFDFSDSYLINGLDKIKDILDLEILRIGGSNLRDVSIPINLNQSPTLKVISLRGDYVTLPKGITDCLNCEQLELSNSDGNGYGSAQNWGDGVTKMTELVFLTYRTFSQSFPTAAPMGIENCPKIKSITIGPTYRSQIAVNSHVMSYLNKLNDVADKKPTALNKFRTVAFDIGTSLTTTHAIRPSGIYQAPSGFVLGTNNGTPATAMEAIYVFVKQWGWTVTVRNEANTGTEIYNP